MNIPENGFYGVVCAEHSKDVDTLDQVPYPCTFITEVATDLGISECDCEGTNAVVYCKDCGIKKAGNGK